MHTTENGNILFKKRKCAHIVPNHMPHVHVLENIFISNSFSRLLLLLFSPCLEETHHAGAWRRFAGDRKGEDAATRVSRDLERGLGGHGGRQKRRTLPAVSRWPVHSGPNNDQTRLTHSSGPISNTLVVLLAAWEK